jgi:hypothetical protein
MPRLAPHLEKPQFFGRLRDELLSATPRNGNKAQSPPTMRQLLKLLTRRAVTSKPYEGTSPEAETSTLAPFPAVLALSLAKTHAPGLRRAPGTRGRLGAYAGARLPIRRGCRAEARKIGASLIKIEARQLCALLESGRPCAGGHARSFHCHEITPRASSEGLLTPRPRAFLLWPRRANGPRVAAPGPASGTSRCSSRGTAPPPPACRSRRPCRPRLRPPARGR